MLEGNAHDLASTAEQLARPGTRDLRWFHSDNAPAGISCAAEKGSRGTANIEQTAADDVLLNNSQMALRGFEPSHRLFLIHLVVKLAIKSGKFLFGGPQPAKAEPTIAAAQDFAVRNVLPRRTQGGSRQLLVFIIAVGLHIPTGAEGTDKTTGGSF